MKRIEKIARSISEPDKKYELKAQDWLDNLTKPIGSLGVLEDVIKKIAAVTRDAKPKIKNKVIFLFAGDHGVTDENVSAYPKDVTKEMVYNFIRGGAAINVLAKHVGAKVVIADIGVSGKLKPHPNLIINKIKPGTQNMAKGPAMTREEAIMCVNAGIDIFMNEFKNSIDLAGTGDMGIGNTTPSSAIAAVFTKLPVENVTGRGTGIDDKGYRNKVEVIKRAISINKPDAGDPIDVLSKVGGLEIGALAGVILGAASKKVPVVIDGFISGAAALIANHLEPKTKYYMIAGHSSVEQGHRIILEYMGLKPVLNLEMRLGEGTGASIAMNIVEAACKIVNEMATFKKAEVSEKIK